MCPLLCDECRWPIRRGFPAGQKRFQVSRFLLAQRRPRHTSRRSGLQGIEQESREPPRPILLANVAECHRPKRHRGKGGLPRLHVRTPIRRPIGGIRFVARHATHAVVQRLPASRVSLDAAPRGRIVCRRKQKLNQCGHRFLARASREVTPHPWHGRAGLHALRVR